MSQKLSVLLLVFGLAWGLLLLHYTVQQPRHQSSAELREQILELSRRYVKVLTEENQNAPGGLQGTSMAGYGKDSGGQETCYAIHLLFCNIVFFPAHEITCLLLNIGFQHYKKNIIKKTYSIIDTFSSLCFFVPPPHFLSLSHAHTADLKRTIAVLLEDILTRLVKLEGRIELAVNVSSTNTSHTAGGVLASAPAALQKPSKQDTPGSHPGTPRLHPHIPNRPRPHHQA